MNCGGGDHIQDAEANDSGGELGWRVDELAATKEQRDLARDQSRQPDLSAEDDQRNDDQPVLGEQCRHPGPLPFSDSRDVKRFLRSPLR